MTSFAESMVYVEIGEKFLGFYKMCIDYHLMSFPVPRLFYINGSINGGTSVLVRELKLIYPKSLKVGSTIISLYWPKHDYRIGPYKILIQKEQHDEQ